MNARQKFVAARTALILDEPFFGTLALKLAIVEDPSCKTTWVDGQALGYNPAFIETLCHAELVGLVAHEVMHCAAGHPWRRAGRDFARWNNAADRAINPILREAKFTLPPDAKWESDATHHGKSAEWIYDRLPEPTPDEPPSQQGRPSPDNGGPADPLGEVRDAPTSTDEEGTEAAWQQATQQAAKIAHARGQLPGSLDRFITHAATSRTDWRSALRRFVQELARSDYAWMKPNPRYTLHGLYLPALHSAAMGPIAVAIDTSGSIDGVLLQQFQAELQNIVDEVKPRCTTVLYCDARVHRIETFEPNDIIVLTPIGGGGTDFRPVFDAIALLDEPPICLVYLTDLAGTFPTHAPELPVFWATTEDTVPPFGECVTI